jgi:tRNA (guanine-N7-)-methyltransferase
MKDPSTDGSSSRAGIDHIPSFVRRRGRVTAGQQRALDTLLPRYSIDYARVPLDPALAFGRRAPTVLEIGPGMGETTVAIAANHPETDFLAVEVYPAGIGALLARIDSTRLGNVRVIAHDAYEVVRDMLAPDSLAGVHVFFPDPWPKTRHHKRRLIQPEFVRLLASRIARGGYLHCATDWQDYAAQMLQVLSREPRLRNLHDDYAPAPRNPLAERTTTKFHTRGEKLGHGVWDLVFVRKEPMREERQATATTPGY